MRTKKEPRVWIHPDKFEHLRKLQESIGDEAFYALSEDEKDVEAAIRCLAEILIEGYLRKKGWWIDMTNDF